MIKKISIRAILVGSLVDIIGTGIWGAVLIVYLISVHRILPGPLLAIQIKEVSSISSHPGIFLIKFAGGIIFSIVGGYTAAAIAKRNELIYGALSSFLCVGSGIYSVLKGSNTFPLIVQLIILLISPMLGLLGGYLNLKKYKRTLPS